MVSQSFAPVWSHEVALALGPSLGQPASSPSQDLPQGPTVHVAIDGDGAVVAFAAHDGNNRGLGWFGPMGTLDKTSRAWTGEGFVARLSARRFDRPDGGVIAWVGPVGFISAQAAPSPIVALSFRGTVMQGIFATPLRAMVLAAGMGSRLGGISDELPKPLLPV